MKITILIIETEEGKSSPKKQSVVFKKKPKIKKTNSSIEQYLIGRLSDQKIADRLGMHRVTVTRYRLAHNLESGRDSKSALISKYYKEGLNDKQISDKLKIHINTVYLWRKRNKKTTNKKGRQ